MEAQCEYSDGTGIYKCDVTQICVIVPNTEIKKFIGTHLPRKSVSDVTWLVIENKTVKFFPENLHKTFQNLTLLEIRNCGLRKISNSDLTGHPNLTIVNFNDNNLVSLPDDLFDNMLKIQYIHFKRNKIENMSSKLLKPLENTLESADFRENVKINEQFFIGYDDDFDEFCEDMNDFQRFSRLIDRCCTPPEPEPIPLDGRDEKIKRLDGMTAHFKNFRNSGKYSDITIKVRCKEFKVHKIILATQSSVFDELFAADGNVGVNSSMNISENISEQTFDSFLNYCYTGWLDPEADAAEIFDLSSTYEVKDLRAESLKRALRNVNENNGLKFFNIGAQHASEDLTQFAFATLKKAYPDLPDNLFNDPETLKKFVEAKQTIASILEAKSL